jgi:microcin C transport system ATP-binding protein
MSLLQVEHLTVRFGSTTVVDDVSFTIAPGEKFALVDPVRVRPCLPCR